MTDLYDLHELLGRAENRGLGQTTSQVALCKRTGATLICGNVQRAEDVRKQYGIKTIAIGATNLKGFRGPVVLEHMTARAMVGTAAWCTDQLKGKEEEINRLRSVLGELEDRLAKLEAALRPFAVEPPQPPLAADHTRAREAMAMLAEPYREEDEMREWRQETVAPDDPRKVFRYGNAPYCLEEMTYKLEDEEVYTLWLEADDCGDMSVADNMTLPWGKSIVEALAERHFPEE